MRNHSLDILRILACLMIVIMHSPMPTVGENGIFLSSLSYLTAPGIGLFFMLSGALLLPIKTDTRSFLKKRFLKIAVPLLFWTFLYLLFFAAFRGRPVTWQTLLSIPFSAQGNPAFWFLYTLLGLYLIAPILSRWVQNASCREIEFFLILWLISLCFPLLRLIVDVNTSETGILYYLSGYVGYFVLGYYLMTYPDKIPFRWLLPIVVIAYVAPIYCKLKNHPVDFYSVFWYLSIFSAIQCAFFWKLILWLTKKQEKPAVKTFFANLSKLSFGIYLVHFFIIRELLWNWVFVTNMLSYYLQTTVIAILAFWGSAAIACLIASIPGLCYLVGFKQPFYKSNYGK